MSQTLYQPVLKTKERKTSNAIIICRTSAYSRIFRNLHLNIKMRYVMVSKKKIIYYLCEDEIKKSIFAIRLVMLNGDSWDGIFLSHPHTYDIFFIIYSQPSL